MPASTPRDRNGVRPLTARPIAREDLSTWRDLHATAGGMMYALPAVDSELRRLLERNNAHLVYDGVENLVGGLTLAPVQPGIASIGIIVRDRFRNMGVGTAILHLAETKLAPTLGIRVLRADVYADNEPMLHLLAATGFREYRNFEKNLPVDDPSTRR